MDIKAINTAIITGTFTNDQLSSIIDAVKFARARVADQTRRSMTIGSKVKFTDPRSNRTYEGVVDKIKIKYMLVNCPTYGDGGQVNVPANMLEVA